MKNENGLPQALNINSYLGKPHEAKHKASETDNNDSVEPSAVDPAGFLGVVAHGDGLVCRE
jgi:hypothetical protein